MSSARPQAAPGYRPRATYRFQFHAGWTLELARAQLDYLAALGVSDVYASPLLLARPGSTHGYDVCDPARLNPELGTEQDWAAFQAGLRHRGMGLLLDIVPNHMGVGHHANRWWWDVLKHGTQSAYANHFDIQWAAPGMAGRVELPILGQPLKACLAAGELRVLREEGDWILAYYDRHLPLSPESLPPRDPQPGSEITVTAMEALLERQHYRLTYWKEGRPNYRRFFDVTELAGVRVEDPEVFEAAHARILDWVARGDVTGLRVDHPDGLRNPADYFLRLQAACLARMNHPPEAWRQATKDALKELAAASPPPPFHVLGEKILSHGEVLPPDWCLHGTTGYEFLNQVNGLFIDPEGCRALADVYARFTGDPDDFESVARQGKRDVLDALFPAEMQSLTDRLRKLASKEPTVASLDRDQLRTVLREWIVALPVYRTYLGPNHTDPTEAERDQIQTATHRGIQSNPTLPTAAFLFLQNLMSPEDGAAVLERDEVMEFVVRLQQLTGPATAKGVEDTAFYRYYRLTSLNEVGGEPGRDGVSVDAFHAFQQDRAANWPHALSTSATHDTKRGEDVRARLNVLSEIPREWERLVQEWRDEASAMKTIVNGRAAPSVHDEYLIYQTLAGTWPTDVTPDSMPADFKARIGEYLAKAMKESKRESSWLDPNTEYENAARDFGWALLKSESFLSQLIPLAGRIARVGTINSLAQTLLKIVAPGIPDIYQGTELWDLSLVDPDNRRPVNYPKRRELLVTLEREWAEREGARGDWLGEMLEHWPDGRVKMFTMWRALQCRRAFPNLFAAGAYQPLIPTGPRAAHLCAFARHQADAVALVVVPRCVARMMSASEMPYPASAWEGTGVKLPAPWTTHEWRNEMTGTHVQADTNGLDAAAMFASFPVALLTAGKGARKGS